MLWFVVTFAITLGFSHLLVRNAQAWSLVDMPEARKVHVMPTPRTGGLAIALALAATFGIRALVGYASWPSMPWQTLTAGLGFTLLGGLDDRFHFRPRQKFLWLVGLSALAAWPWVHQGQAQPGFGFHLGSHAFVLPRSLAYGLITLWFLAVPNAVNIEDAINGYMGGYTLLILLVAGSMGVPTALPAGALAAFLLLNWPKAKHFLGDAGSFGCGFLIAETLLRAGGAEYPMFALALTAPISLDVAMGILRRLRLGMGLFQADRSTFPHHLAILFGGSHTWATLLLWANASAFIALRMMGADLPLAGYCAAYIGALVMFNRHHLFQVPVPGGNPTAD